MMKNNYNKYCSVFFLTIQQYSRTIVLHCFNQIKLQKLLHCFDENSYNNYCSVLHYYTLWLTEPIYIINVY